MNEPIGLDLDPSTGCQVFNEPNETSTVQKVSKQVSFRLAVITLAEKKSQDDINGLDASWSELGDGVALALKNSITEF